LQGPGRLNGVAEIGKEIRFIGSPPTFRVTRVLPARTSREQPEVWGKRTGLFETTEAAYEWVSLTVHEQRAAPGGWHAQFLDDCIGSLRRQFRLSRAASESILMDAIDYHRTQSENEHLRWTN
jgi:hypothetical protein